MLTRRDFSLAALAAGVAAPSLLRAAEPLKIGWITVLTGPSSAPGHGYQRGMEFAVKKLNEAGGIAGRPIEIVLRDTAGDPAKAVNAVTELGARTKVDLIWGPSSSGESLASTAVMQRYGIPNLIPGFLDALITPETSNIFRLAPKQSQLELAITDYIGNRLGVTDVAVISDIAGYGLAAAEAQVTSLEAAGANVVYRAQIDPAQPDVTPDVSRAIEAGAKALVPWTVNAGLMARLMNTRATLGWDAPIVGHSALGSGEVQKLLDKPENWENVYSVGFRNCSYQSDGKLPDFTADFVEEFKQSGELSDTLLFWVATGRDAVMSFAQAVEAAGSTDADQVNAAMVSASPFEGAMANWRFTANNHNGLADGDVVMVEANSFSDGAFTLAPGYS